MTKAVVDSLTALGKLQCCFGCALHIPKNYKHFIVRSRIFLARPKWTQYWHFFPGFILTLMCDSKVLGDLVFLNLSPLTHSKEDFSHWFLMQILCKYSLFHTFTFWVFYEAQSPIMFFLAPTYVLSFAAPVGQHVSEVAHEHVPALRQWLATKGIRNSYDSWHGRLPTKVLYFTGMD